jgi:hypothetical protein
VERMVSAMLDADNALPHSAPDFAAYARAALSVARREIREECARVAEVRTEYWYPQVGDEIAAAIRAME